MRIDTSNIVELIDNEGDIINEDILNSRLNIINQIEQQNSIN